ncbi:MAG: hypothetical protein Q8P81_03405 [Nanoarchaeota archaeon]|nr:hypothetical protein [Nanoarchaeota archaeon]
MINLFKKICCKIGLHGEFMNAIYCIEIIEEGVSLKVKCRWCGKEGIWHRGKRIVFDGGKDG